MSKHSQKHETKHKINKSKVIGVIALVVFIILIINLIPKDNHTDISLVLNNEEISEELSDKLLQVGNTIYMSYEDVTRYIDKTIYKEDDETIITTSSKKVACLKVDNSTILVNGAEVNLEAGVIKVNEKIYLPISELKSVYDIDFNFSSKSNIAVIDDLSTQKKIATSKGNISIKKEKSIFSKTLDKVKKGETVTYIEEDGKWSKVISKEGYIGFVKTSKLKDINIDREEFKFEDNYIEGNYLEKDISKMDISKFEKRQDIIQKIFIEAMNKEKMYVKIISNENDTYYERMKIEAIPVFRECGIKCEFSN